MAQAAVAVTPQKRKQVLKVLFISLLLDLVSRVNHVSTASTVLTVIPTLDLLYLYSPTVPQAPRVLPRRRCLDNIFVNKSNPPLSRTGSPQCIQEHLCQTNQ